MRPSYLHSIARAALLLLLLAVVAGSVIGCGDGDPYTGSWGTAGILSIEKEGDRYLIHDPIAPFEKDYEGRMEAGKLVAETKLTTYVFTIEEEWLVQEGGGMEIRYERN